MKKPKTKMFGNIIRAILVEKEMSPQELSDLSGVDPSHLSKIINGKRSCISLPVAIKIAQAIGKPVEDIFIYKTKVVRSTEELEGE